MELFAGRYHLVDPIADGGMGSVWRAWDAKRGGYVAAKLLRPADAASLLRFVREQALRVVHPNVVAPNGWAAEDELVLLTMDLVGGGSLHQLIGDYGAIPVPYTAVLVDQLWSALTEVHAHGIVHRDVKPANVLLEVTGRGAPVARLADFGIAAVAGQPRLTEATEIVGTPGYLAPEAFRDGQPRPGHDVYAAGIVAWRLLTGLTPPPDGPAIDPESPPADVPAPVWRAVARLTAADAAHRPATAAEAWREWRSALSAAAVPGVDADRPDAIEVFDQLGPLPDGFGPTGPVRTATAAHTPSAGPPPEAPTIAIPPSTPAGQSPEAAAAPTSPSSPPSAAPTGPTSPAAPVATPPTSLPPAAPGGHTPPAAPAPTPPMGPPPAAPTGPRPIGEAGTVAAQPAAYNTPTGPTSPAAQPYRPQPVNAAGAVPNPAGPQFGAEAANPGAPAGPHTSRPPDGATTGGPVPTVPMPRDIRRRVAVGVAVGATVLGAVVLAISLILLLA